VGGVVTATSKHMSTAHYCFYGTFGAVLRTRRCPDIRRHVSGTLGSKIVYPHEQPEQGSTNFQEIRYKAASLKYVDTVQFWLKQDNNGQFLENPT
jgi:hypothetical protein